MIGHQGRTTLDKGLGRAQTLMGMGRLDSDLEDLYRRRQEAFQVMLASVTGSVESARDVVQEAFARALQNQNGFRGEGSLEGWVWRIAFRVAIGSHGSRGLAVEEVPEVAFVDDGATQPSPACSGRTVRCTRAGSAAGGLGRRRRPGQAQSGAFARVSRIHGPGRAFLAAASSSFLP
jgi:hypothetical protein